MKFKPFKLIDYQRQYLRFIRKLKGDEIIYIQNSYKSFKENIKRWMKITGFEFEYHKCVNGGFILRRKQEKKK